jgi:hypothetical protein
LTSITVNLGEHPQVYISSDKRLVDQRRGTLLREAAAVLSDYGEAILRRAESFEVNAPVAA